MQEVVVAATNAELHSFTDNVNSCFSILLCTKLRIKYSTNHDRFANWSSNYSTLQTEDNKTTDGGLERAVRPSLLGAPPSERPTVY